MLIESLTIGSYKSFLQPTRLPLSPVFDVFIGPNNCGKTNILDAIDFLSHPDKDPARLHHHRAQLEMIVRFNDHERKKFRGLERVIIEGKQYSVSARDPHGVAVDPDVMSYIGARVKMLQYEDFSDFVQIEKDYTSFAERYPQEFQYMMNLLHTYFPDINTIESIVDASADNFGTVSIGSKSITIDRLGGGFRRVLVILLYALHPEFSVVLIDEPEIHLHPGLIKKVLRIVAKDTANQIIVTSHSPLFITAERLDEVYRVLKDEQGSHVYSLAQQQTSIDRQRLVQELNADNLEMFFADKVLLVEGVSDRILMRGLIDRFYQGADDIKVIYTHGKSNIDIYIDLMRTFHIPYIVMLDRDALPALADQFGLRRGSGTGANQFGRMIEELRNHHIFILENGAIENNYPRKYQGKDSKPLNALYASVNITPQEYASGGMKSLKNIIDRL